MLLTVSSLFKVPEPLATQKPDKLLATQVQEGPGILPFKIRATLNLRGSSGQMARALSQTPTLSGLCFPIIKRRLPSSDFLGSFVWPQMKRQVPGSSIPHKGEPALEYTHSEPVYTCTCVAWPRKHVHAHTQEDPQELVPAPHPTEGETKAKWGWGVTCPGPHGRKPGCPVAPSPPYSQCPRCPSHHPRASRPFYPKLNPGPALPELTLGHNPST